MKTIISFMCIILLFVVVGCDSDHIEPGITTIEIHENGDISIISESTYEGERYIGGFTIHQNGDMYVHTASDFFDEESNDVLLPIILNKYEGVES